MLRRAMAAQMDMGMGEMVVSSNRHARACRGELPLVSAARIVPAEEAIKMSGMDEPVQNSMNLIQAASYASLEEHRAAICDCQQCPLGQSRNKFVYGAGSPKADLMFVGEAPGADEDRIGEPFVGRAGQLLDKILAAMKLNRDEVYIANILKCRPPGNRDPQPEEMSRCFPYLREQVRLISPKIICALGRIAAQAMLQTNTPLGRLRGKWHSFESVPVLVTYHPAALLRFPAYKKDTWADMQIVMARLNEEG